MESNNASKIALEEASGPITDLLQRLTGKNGKEWLEILKATLRKNEYVALAKNFRTLAKFRLEEFKSTEDLFRASRKKWPGGKGQEARLAEIAFTHQEGEVEIVEAFVAELGFHDDASYESVYCRIVELGYDLCEQQDAFHVAANISPRDKEYIYFISKPFLDLRILSLVSERPAFYSHVGVYPCGKDQTFYYWSRVAFRRKKSLSEQNQVDPWADQKKKIECFYKSCFGLTIDWSEVSTPEFSDKYSRLEYVHAEFDCKRYITACKKRFGDTSVADNSWSQNPDMAVSVQQIRPKGNYCFARLDSNEADSEHLEKSYNDFHNDGNQYMVLKEGIIVAFHERFEKGAVLDYKSLTILHSLNGADNVLRMCYERLAGFCIAPNLRNHHASDSGPRQIKI